MQERRCDAIMPHPNYLSSPGSRTQLQPVYSPPSVVWGLPSPPLQDKAHRDLAQIGCAAKSRAWLSQGSGVDSWRQQSSLSLLIVLLTEDRVWDSVPLVSFHRTGEMQGDSCKSQGCYGGPANEGLCAGQSSMMIKESPTGERTSREWGAARSSRDHLAMSPAAVLYVFKMWQRFFAWPNFIQALVSSPRPICALPCKI